MTESFELRTLLFESDEFLNSDFRFQNGLASNLLNFLNKLLMPLLIFFVELLLIGQFVLIMKLIGRVKSVIEVSSISLVGYWLVKYLLNKLILK